MTEGEIGEIIERFNTDREFRISRAFLDGGIDPLPGRLNRAAIDQLSEDEAMVSRYGIWANTVRDNIRQAVVEIENGNMDEARRLLRRSANSLSAFAELQAHFDTMGIGSPAQKSMESAMDIYRFSAALAQVISEETPSVNLKNEAEFERNHVIAPAWLLSERYPEIRVFVHPEGSKKKCIAGCDAGVRDSSQRVRGCKDCWARSKDWSVVEALGTKNNFDLVALDRSNKSLAVEVKLLSLSSNKGPNSEFQRFIGQCVLAAARNNYVLGVCCFRGTRKKEYDTHRSRLEATLKKIGVRLVTVYAK